MNADANANGEKGQRQSEKEREKEKEREGVCVCASACFVCKERHRGCAMAIKAHKGGVSRVEQQKYKSTKDRTDGCIYVIEGKETRQKKGGGQSRREQWAMAHHGHVHLQRDSGLHHGKRTHGQGR